MQGVSNYKQCKDIICKVNQQLDCLNFFGEILPEVKFEKLKPLKQQYRSNALNLWVKHLNVIFLILLLFLCGCSKAQEITTYTIPKGEHKSVYKMDLCPYYLENEIMFDNSAMYNLHSSDQYDVNKLFGFNSCNSLHHSNSARFGWCYISGDSIDIYSYVYENSVRYFQKIFTVKIGEWNNYKITDNYYAYVFQVNEYTYIHTKEQGCITNYHYMLYPYFGGNQTAPHDINIYFK